MTIYDKGDNTYNCFREFITTNNILIPRRNLSGIELMVCSSSLISSPDKPEINSTRSVIGFTTERKKRAVISSMVHLSFHEIVLVTR